MSTIVNQLAQVSCSLTGSVVLKPTEWSAGRGRAWARMEQEPPLRPVTVADLEHLITAAGRLHRAFGGRGA